MIASTGASPARWWLVAALLFTFVLLDRLVIDPERNPAWVERWSRRLDDLAAFPAHLPPGWTAVDRSQPVDLTTRMTRFFSVTGSQDRGHFLVSIGYVHDPAACYEDAGYTVGDHALVRTDHQTASRFIRRKGGEENVVWHWFVELDTLSSVGTSDLADRLHRIGLAVRKGRALELLHAKVLADTTATPIPVLTDPVHQAELIDAIAAGIRACRSTNP